MLLHARILCKKTARAPWGHNKFILTKLGGSRVDLNILLFSTLMCKKIAHAPEGHKRFMFTKMHGKHNRSNYLNN